MLSAERTYGFWVRCSHPVHMSGTKLHGDITTAILAENYPKTIYNMVAFEFANTVANKNEFHGAECKFVLDAF